MVGKIYYRRPKDLQKVEEKQFQNTFPGLSKRSEYFCRCYLVSWKVKVQPSCILLSWKERVRRRSTSSLAALS